MRSCADWLVAVGLWGDTMKRLSTLLFSLCLLLASGCSSLYMNIPMTRPANADISGIRKIAVLGLFPGPDTPPSFSSELTGRLAANLTSNGYFTVMEHPDLMAVLARLQIPPEALNDPQGLARLGQGLDVDAVIIGNVDSLRVQDTHGVDVLDVRVPVIAPVVGVGGGGTVVLPPPPVAPAPVVVVPPPPRGRRHQPVVVAPPPPRHAPPAQPGYVIERRPFPFVARTATLAMKLQLVRTKDAKLVYMQPQMYSASGKIYPGPQPHPEPSYHNRPALGTSPYVMRALPDPEAMVSVFAAEMGSSFAAQIVPTRYTKRIEFASDDHPDNKRGLEFCRGNAWNLAYQAFTEGLAKAPNNAAMHYNLGILRESDGDYATASAEYQRALSIDPGNKLFQRTYRSLQDTLAEQEVVRHQTAPQP